MVRARGEVVRARREVRCRGRSPVDTTSGRVEGGSSTVDREAASDSATPPNRSRVLTGVDHHRRARRPSRWAVTVSVCRGRRVHDADTLSHGTAVRVGGCVTGDRDVRSVRRWGASRRSPRRRTDCLVAASRAGVLVDVACPDAEPSSERTDPSSSRPTRSSAIGVGHLASMRLTQRPKSSVLPGGMVPCVGRVPAVVPRVPDTLATLAAAISTVERWRIRRFIPV